MNGDVSSQPRRLAPLVALTVSATLSLVATPTGAKGTVEQDVVITLYQEAVELFQEEKFEAAIELFEKALEHGAPSLTLYNIARCYEAIEDFEQAIAYYQQYIEAPDAQDVQSVEETIAGLQATPSEVSIVSEPTGGEVTEVLGDGSETALGETPLTITAEAGTHTYLIALEGHKTKKIKVKAGLGKPREVEVTLTPKEDEDLGDGDGMPPRETLGLTFEVGGGMALHIKEILQPGGEVSLGASWRFAHGPATGFSVGLRAGFRPFTLDATIMGTGEEQSFRSLFATILAVGAFQVQLHERLGLEMTLPLGFAILSATETVPSDADVDLLGGYPRGGGLTLFDLGFGAALRIMIVSGLFVAVEPVRIQMLFPLTEWENDTKLLFDMDFTIRIGFEI